MIQWLFIILLGWGIAAPLVTWGVLDTKHAIEKTIAVSKARKQEKFICTGQIRDVESKQNAKVQTEVNEALAAANAFKLPDDLAKLCGRSASCRERQSYKQ